MADSRERDDDDELIYKVINTVKLKDGVGIYFIFFNLGRVSVNFYSVSHRCILSVFQPKLLTLPER